MRPFILLLLLVAACGPMPRTPSGPALPPPGEDSCNAGARVSLVGQEATALERVLILGQVRVLRPGTAMTMDFRPDRLNFEVDETGRIARIFCG